jgi:hypothetical protein
MAVLPVDSTRRVRQDDTHEEVYGGTVVFYE